MQGRGQQEVLFSLGSRRASPRIPLSYKRALAKAVGIGVWRSPGFSPPQLIRCGHGILCQGPPDMVCREGYGGGELCWCEAWEGRGRTLNFTFRSGTTFKWTPRGVIHSGHI